MPDVGAALAHVRKAREHLERAEEALLTDNAEQKVLAVVTEEMTVGAIQEATDLSYAAVTQACSRLVRSGGLRRVRHGVYAPAAAPPPSPAVDTRMGCVERAIPRRRAGT